MSIKLFGAASALVLSLGLGGAAYADTVSAGGAGSLASSQENGNVSRSNNQANGNNNSKNFSLGISKTSTELENSQNTKVIDSYNTEVKTRDSHNLSTEDSHNVEVTTKTFNISNQDLDGSVSNIQFSRSGEQEGNGADPDNRSINTGGVSWNGNAFLGMAGIQTTSTNTGVGSLNQTATMVSANANVTFGHN
ncbi:MAG: hypothetical protein JWP86_464 [Phenylobacterium sp.]|nr:hypothetical protein [Phenylobacterium sp.]